MHNFIRMNNGTAIKMSYALMPQAHAEDRFGATQSLNCGHRNTLLVRGAGAWRNLDMAGVAMQNFLDVDLIVANHLDCRTKLTQILHQVVGK